MTAAEFKARFPEFTSTDDPKVQQELDDAVLELDVDRWGTRYNRGLGLLAAHRLAVSRQQASDPFFGTGSGSSSTKEVGSVKLTRSTSFTNKSGGGEELDLTLYGQQYKTMRDEVGIGALAV